MKIGIVTLVSDNYGNKFQNYAVEQLLRHYGEVVTFRVEECGNAAQAHEKPLIQKLRLSHIRQVLISRMMYTYDINNAERSVLGNLLYVIRNKTALVEARERRHQSFLAFEKKHLHIAEKVITHDNAKPDWVESFDYFVCGSDQIWNPNYATTSDLAFLSFSPKEKNIALAPSFGVSEIPEACKELFRAGLNGIGSLSVREEAGANVIHELTGRNAEVLVDPTMAIDADVWKALAQKPETKIPQNYILCYFLGRVDGQYKTVIRKLAQERKLEIVPLFDIEHPEYYTMDPAQVLYCIQHAQIVMTDSFHGAVFSILFHKNFRVFERNEGGASMNSRLETLLTKFNLQGRNSRSAVEECVDWRQVEAVLAKEREKYGKYIAALPLAHATIKGNINEI